MQIKFEDLKRGDEILITSNSNLRYLKLLHKTKKGSWRCSMGNQKKIFRIGKSYTQDVLNHLQPNTDEHNLVFYLKNEEDYIDMWLVRREP